MQRILGPKFFSRTADLVAPDLLGKFLVRERGGTREAHMITEAETYDGFEDKASHAAKGRTPRTEVMYGPPGHWYVYFIYGMYEMLNIVCGPKGHPGGVLIRGVVGIDGPGKLTRELGITRDFYGKAATPRNGLWIEDRGIAIPRSGMVATPRIGVAYAGEWAMKEWRFVIAAHEKGKRAPK
jgi:DNA-3-methyladenine glycosylase